MIGRVPARRRFAIVTALGLGLAVVAGAQENVPSAGETTGSRDAIADAKKDFDKIKSARDAALLPGSQLPRVGVPELTLPVAPPTTVAPQSKTPPRDTKSANWLVDAMAKQGSTRDRKSRGGTQGESELEEEREAHRLAESDEGRGRREQRETREPESKPVVFNPLTTFLGDWMTPQDYALLKPGLTSGLEAGTAAKNPVAPTAGVGFAAVGGMADISFGIPTSPTAALPQPPRENPYLQSLKPDLPAVPEMKPAFSPPVSGLPRATGTVSPPPPPVTPKTPDFARPSEDDRYFKQLKRF